VDAPHVWIAKDDGTDIIRAGAVVGVGMDYSGHITARMADHEGSAVTLVVPGSHQVPPDDFHRQLIRVIAELSDAAGAFMVRPVCEEPRGWRWVTEAL
jgi:nicotinamidase-related amidase